MKRFYIARLSHLDSPPRAASSGTAPRVPRWMERRAKAFPGQRKARPPACPLSRQSVPRMAGVGGALHPGQSCLTSHPRQALCSHTPDAKLLSFLRSSPTLGRMAPGSPACSVSPAPAPWGCGTHARPTASLQSKPCGPGESGPGRLRSRADPPPSGRHCLPTWVRRAGRRHIGGSRASGSQSEPLSIISQFVKMHSAPNGISTHFPACLPLF